MSIQQMFLGAGGGGSLSVDDVFSTDTWPGDGNTQDITNGIDLATEGGMVWTKNRDTQARHTLTCTDFNKTGTYYDEFVSNDDWNLQANRNYGITTFNNDGFTLGGDDLVFNSSNPEDYVSWTFRKAPGFLDVITWPGDNSSTNILDHDLGSTPGAIFLKRTIGGSQHWAVWHRSTGISQLVLNDTGTTWYNNITSVGSTTFTVDTNFNYSGSTYVAYVFAHDDAKFDGESIINCGEFSTDASGTSNTVTTDFRTQWILYKRYDGSGKWKMFDSKRSNFTNRLTANEDTEELTNRGPVTVTDTTFTVSNEDSSSDYIYIAIAA